MDAGLLNWHFYVIVIAYSLHFSFSKPHTLIWKSPLCHRAIQKQREGGFCSCLCVHNSSYFFKLQTSTNNRLFKEVKLCALKHLMHQNQLIVDFRLEWWIIAEALEARGSEIYKSYTEVLHVSILQKTLLTAAVHISEFDGPDLRRTLTLPSTDLKL